MSNIGEAEEDGGDTSSKFSGSSGGKPIVPSRPPKRVGTFGQSLRENFSSFAMWRKKHRRTDTNMTNRTNSTESSSSALGNGLDHKKVKQISSENLSSQHSNEGRILSRGSSSGNKKMKKKAKVTRSNQVDAKTINELLKIRNQKYFCPKISAVVIENRQSGAEGYLLDAHHVIHISRGSGSLLSLGGGDLQGDQGSDVGSEDDFGMDIGDSDSETRDASHVTEDKPQLSRAMQARIDKRIAARDIMHRRWQKARNLSQIMPPKPLTSADLTYCNLTPKQQQCRRGKSGNQRGERWLRKGKNKQRYNSSTPGSETGSLRYDTQGDRIKSSGSFLARANSKLVSGGSALMSIPSVKSRK